MHIGFFVVGRGHYKQLYMKGGSTETFRAQLDTIRLKAAKY